MIALLCSVLISSTSSKIVVDSLSLEQADQVVSMLRSWNIGCYAHGSRSFCVEVRSNKYKLAVKKLWANSEFTSMLKRRPKFIVTGIEHGSVSKQHEKMIFERLYD